MPRYGLGEGKMAETPSSEEVSTKLQQVAELAKKAPEVAFTTLAHHIDIWFLYEALLRTRADGAPGVDGQTAAQYAQNLGTNLRLLLDRFKSGTYRAPAVRRVHIPKADGTKTRPIGVPTFEDKVLQRAVAMVVEAVYEQDFLNCSYGFRPGRSAHQALEALWRGLMDMGGAVVIEVDIQSFLDASSYCTPVCCSAGKESWHHFRKLDSQAFSAPLPDVHGLKLAALYTLQDSLAADAQSERGLEHRDVA